LKGNLRYKIADHSGGYTRVRRTEGLLRSIIGAVVHGTRRRENPS